MRLQNQGKLATKGTKGTKNTLVFFVPLVLFVVNFPSSGAHLQYG